MQNHLLKIRVAQSICVMLLIVTLTCVILKHIMTYVIMLCLV